MILELVGLGWLNLKVVPKKLLLAITTDVILS